MDTIFQLRATLSRIEEAEMLEKSISEELESIKAQFGFEDDKTEGFYGEMCNDSIGRSKRLMAFKHRVKGLLERLTLFLQIKDRDEGYWD